MKRRSFLIGVAASAAGAAWAAPEPVPLPQAHAHNDYRHPRPLADALARGFCSVEADIHLAEGELLVGHDPPDLRPGRTLERLYLAPLRERARRHGGRIYPGGPAFILLIDIKTDAEPTYAVLRAALARYADLLTRCEGENVRPGAVTAILSGNRPRKVLEAEARRYAALDGRLEDLERPAAKGLIPLVSSNWTLSFTWRGEGPMPDAERARLREIVAKAHARGYQLRFWATPDRPAVWRELIAAGVDLINTDDLDGLRDFLISK